MITLHIVPDGDGALAEYCDRKIMAGRMFMVSGLAGGTASGDPSVGVIIELVDGTLIYGETSLRLFLTAADTLKARYGDPRI